MKTLLALSIAISCGTFAVMGILRLQPHFDPKALLDLDSSVLQEAQEFETLFGPATAKAAFVLEAADILAPEALIRIHALSLEAASYGTVISLTHLPLPHVGEGDLDATLTLLESAPLAFPTGLIGLGERMGGELTISPIADTPQLSEEQREGLVDAAPHVEGRLINAAHTRALVLVDGIGVSDARQLAEAHGARLTGIELLQDRIESGMRNEGALLVGVALLLTVILLGVAFRSAAAVGLPMIASGVTLLIAMGTLGWWTGQLTLLTAIVPPVLLTICVGDALHLMARYAEERRHADNETAARIARKTMWRACLATSLTTAIGFGSLVSASTPALQLFGMVSAAGVVVAFFVVVQVLPSLLSRSRWKGRTFNGERHARIALWFAGRPFPILLFSALIVVPCTLGALHLDQGTRLLSPFASDEPLAETARLIDSEFGGVRQMECLVRGEPLAASTLERAESLSAWARTNEHVADVRSASSLMNEVWSELSDLPRPVASNGPLAALLGPAINDLVSDEGLRIQLSVRDAAAGELLLLGASAREHGADALSGEAWHAGAGLS